MVVAVRVLTAKVSARLRQNTDNAAMGMDQIFFLNDIALNMVASFDPIRPDRRKNNRFAILYRLLLSLLEQRQQGT
jgi:hypothetical protein